jgi:hypothetical protein
LREAANCYIVGFPQATVSSARAAIEASLRNAVSKTTECSPVDGSTVIVAPAHRTVKAEAGVAVELRTAERPDHAAAVGADEARARRAGVHLTK